MEEVEGYLLQQTGATKVKSVHPVQTLWSGYGQINRYLLSGGRYPSVIVKHIQWPAQRNHPRGWNTDKSHQRKLKSYEVEKTWYLNYSAKTNDQCKVPYLIKAIEQDDQLLLIMEDLDDSGYQLRLSPETVRISDVKAVLGWLGHRASAC